MNEREIKRRFPNASPTFIKANLDPESSRSKGVDIDYHGDNLSDVPVPYTSEEDEKILKFYRDRAGLPVNLNDLAVLLGRSRWSVAMRASRLAVTESNRPKSDEVKAKFSTVQLNRTRTKAEKEAASNRQKQYLSQFGHPRGFKGHKRTPEELSKMREASQKAWKDPNHMLNSKEHRQVLSDRMSKMVQQRPPENSFSRARYGKRPDLGNVFFRSAWEANYARYLNFLIKNEGSVSRWEYEPDTFWFEKIKRGCRSYKPDFKVFLKNGEVEYHEVKGWMYDRSKTALRRMNKYHPTIRIVLIDQSRYKPIARQMCKIIKGWE